jgi:hypothetical protein
MKTSGTKISLLQGLRDRKAHGASAMNHAGDLFCDASLRRAGSVSGWASAPLAGESKNSASAQVFRHCCDTATLNEILVIIAS